LGGGIKLQAPHLEGARILVVDDDQVTCSMLEEILKRQNFHVSTAHDGQEAWALMLAGELDLILLDVIIPKSDGFEILRRMKNHPALEGIPVILISASDRVDEKIKGFELGANDYVSKPFAGKEMIARINTQLRLKALQQELATKNRQLEERNRFLQQLVYLDELTGIFNKRYLLERAVREVRRSLRYQSPLSCLMIDIDYFKNINDRLGHQSGDLVLYELAQLLKISIRGTDILARYGGEEFTILCPETSMSQAYTLAERLRLTVRRHLFLGDRGGLHLSISIGVASFWNYKGNQTYNSRQIIKEAKKMVEHLFATADQALYAAKQKGRNRTERRLSPGLYFSSC